MPAQVASRTLSFLTITLFAGLVWPLTLPGYSSLSENASLLPDRTADLSAPPTYPVTCFNPYSTRLGLANAEDCDLTINEMILRMPNPMAYQSWGYSDDVDIDLRVYENEKWVLGRCVIFVRNQVKRRVDRFRVVDVASTASRIVRQCIVEMRYPIGGTANIGSRPNNFYVGVGGLIESGLANSTRLILPSNDR